jgi:SNF2 family DNA or RNA helicase
MNTKDYFDPSWITVDRILNVHTDDEVSDDEEEHADVANRVFYIKWVNKNYSSNSYESEQDLILNGIEYIDQLAAYESRSKKPTKEDMKAKMEIRKAGIERLLQVFGPSATDELRESAIKEYQVNLEKKVYGNGGQLRDYQAEGVTWLVSNHINNRGSFLADEMGLG